MSDEARQAAERAVEVLREWNPLMHPNWTEDAIAAILTESAPMLAAKDAEMTALKEQLARTIRYFVNMTAERDRFEKQVEELKRLLAGARSLIVHEWPGWREWEDHIHEIDAALTEQPHD